MARAKSQVELELAMGSGSIPFRYAQSKSIQASLLLARPGELSAACSCQPAWTPDLLGKREGCVPERPFLSRLSQVLGRHG